VFCHVDVLIVSLFVRYPGEDDEYINNYGSYSGNCYSNNSNNFGNSTGNSGNNDEYSNASSSKKAIAMIEIGGGVTARANFICKNHKKCGEIR
jgi:hypothetical protein